MEAKLTHFNNLYSVNAVMLSTLHYDVSVMCK